MARWVDGRILDVDEAPEPAITSRKVALLARRIHGLPIPDGAANRMSPARLGRPITARRSPPGWRETIPRGTGGGPLEPIGEVSLRHAGVNAGGQPCSATATCTRRIWCSARTAGEALILDWEYAHVSDRSGTSPDGAATTIFRRPAPSCS